MTGEHTDAERAPHWHDYPLSIGARLVLGLNQASVAVSVGLLVTFCLLFPLGLAAEEDALDPLFTALQLSESQRYGLPNFIDAFGRMLLAPVGIGIIVAVGVYVATRFALAVSTSRELTRIARAGGDRNIVPSPRQVGMLGASSYAPLTIYLLIIGCVALILTLFLLFVVTQDSSQEVVVGLVVCAAVTTVTLGLDFVLRRTVRKGQLERLEEIARYWASTEPRAWKRARARSDENTLLARSDRAGRTALARTAHWLNVGAMVLVVGGFFGLIIVGLLTHPDAQLWRGGQLGERGEYSDATEAAINVAVLIGAIVMAVGVLVLIVALWLSAAAERGEHERLLMAIEADAPLHVDTLDRQHNNPEPSGYAQFLAAVGAALCAVSIGLILVQQPWSAGAERTAAAVGSATNFAWVGVIAGFILIAIGVIWNALHAPKSTQLRNLLLREAPYRRPKPSKESDDNLADHFAGPILTKIASGVRKVDD